MARKMLFRLSGRHILMIFLVTIDQTCSFGRKNPMPAVKIEEIDEYERELSKYSDRHEGRAKILISFAPGHRDIDDDDVGPGTKFAAELATKLQKKDYMSYSRLHTLAGVQAHEEFLRRLENDCRTLILIVTQQYLEDLDSLDVLDKAIDYDTNIIPMLYGMNNMPDDTKWWPNANGPGPSKARNKVIGSGVLHYTPFKVRKLQLGPNDDLISRIIRTTHGVKREDVQKWERELQKWNDLNQSKNTDVVVSYSTGNTEHDDRGLGSGTKLVAELAIRLEQEGIKTHTSLHTTTGAYWWDEYLDKLQNECKVLVLILTPAFFKSHLCLRGLYSVDMNRVTIIPVRFDAFPRKKEDWWPNLPDEEFEQMREVVLNKGKVDVQFHNPYYVIDEPTDELIDDVKRAIRDRDSVWGTESTMRLLVLVTIILTLCLALRFMFFRRSDTTDKVYDACFLVLQPSSATPSSHFKFKAVLQSVKKSIETNNLLSGKKVILHGGTGREVHTQLQASQDSNPDRHMVRTQICFVFAYGIDESLWSSYLDTIIAMKPKIVVVCIRHGARRVGEYLSTRGVDIVFWVHFDTSCIDRRSFLIDACLPFSANLLVNKGMSVRACWEEFTKDISRKFPSTLSIAADKSWTSGVLGSKIDDDPQIVKKNSSSPGGGNVEIRISDFGKATLFGFDCNERAFRSYRASHIPWIEPLKDKLKSLSCTQRVRYLHVKIKAENKTTARDLMHLLCMCAVDDETLDISGVYLVRSDDSRNEVCDKILSEEQPVGAAKGNIIVWIDSIGEIFPTPGDLVKWLEAFENIPVTFLLASYPNNNIDKYVKALEDVEGDEQDIRDSSASQCDMTSHCLPDHSRYQGIIRVDLPNHTSISDSIVDLLKKDVARLTCTKADRIDVFADDDVGLVWILVGIRNVSQLKAVLHNLLHGGLKESCPGAKFGVESALTLYREAALQLNMLTEEQIEFIDDDWMKPKNRHVHLKGAAGTGKTFIALHCCLDFLIDTKATEKWVLFICPTKALSYHFARWLLVRITRNRIMRKNLLERIQFLVPNEGDWRVFQIKMERNNLDDLKEDDANDIDFGECGLVIVDEAQAVFCQDSMQQLPAFLLDSLQEGKEKKDRKLLLLSDTSQAQSVESEIQFPFPIDKSFELKTVSRSSENIVAASLPYQLGEKSKCAHGVTGPRVKVHLFKSSLSAIMKQYASKIISIIQDIKNMLDGQDESIHKFMAILVPSKGFRQNLISNSNAFFKKLKLKAVTAEEAMKRKGPDAADKMPWVVVDTVPNVNGLEFGSVIGVALDQCIDTADPAGNKKVQSRIFRCISRGHYAVYILNHIIKDGWFEWLMSVVVTPTRRKEKDDDLRPSYTSEDSTVFTSTNASSNFDQTRDELVDGEAVKDLVVVSTRNNPQSSEDDDSSYASTTALSIDSHWTNGDHAPKLWYGDTFDIFICNEDDDTPFSASDNVDQDPNALRFAPTKVGTNYKAFEFASANLKANKSYVLEAVKQNGYALLHASAELQADKDIVREAVLQNGDALRHASAELKADKDIVHAAVQQDGVALQHAVAELKADKDIVREAVQQHGWALLFASAELQADEELRKVAGWDY